MTPKIHNGVGTEGPLALLQGRAKRDEGYVYDLGEENPAFDGRYAMDTVIADRLKVDEKAMSLWIPFADGNRRDGVGDLLEVTGIRTERHYRNPMVLFDHAKSGVVLPIANAEDPKTHEYTVQIDPVSKTAWCKAFFYQGTGLKKVERDDEYDHALFCEQLFDLMAKRFVRGGSIGFQAVKSYELPAEPARGIVKGLHLVEVLLLEASAVVLPANMDTVRKALDLPTVCGKRLSPILVKSLEAHAPPRKAQLGYEGKSDSVITRLRKVCESLSDIQGLGPDYQRLYWNETKKEAWWESFDGDEDGGVREVYSRIGKVPGVSEVRGESECSPPREEGWERIWPAKKGMGGYPQKDGRDIKPPKTPGQSYFATCQRDQTGHCLPDPSQGQEPQEGFDAAQAPPEQDGDRVGGSVGVQATTQRVPAGSINPDQGNVPVCQGIQDGQVLPPVVVNLGGAYQLVDGFVRLQALMQSGAQEVTVLEVQPEALNSCRDFCGAPDSMSREKWLDQVYAQWAPGQSAQPPAQQGQPGQQPPQQQQQGQQPDQNNGSPPDKGNPPPGQAVTPPAGGEDTSGGGKEPPKEKKEEKKPEKEEKHYAGPAFVRQTVSLPGLRPLSGVGRKYREPATSRARPLGFDETVRVKSMTQTMTRVVKAAPEAMQNQQQAPPPPQQQATDPNGQPPAQPPAESDPLGDEPLGAQILRRIHEDHSILMEEYHEFLQVLEQDKVRDVLTGMMEAIDAVLTEAEDTFASLYGHLDGIAGAEGRQRTTPQQGLEESEESEENQGTEQSGDQSQGDSSGPKRPTPDEAVEGMDKKKKEEVEKDAEEDPNKSRAKDMAFTVSKEIRNLYHKKMCAKCGVSPCGCGTKSKDMGDDGDDEDKALPGHHRKAIEDASAFLKGLSSTKELGDEFRMEAYFHHKSLASVGLEVGGGLIGEAAGGPVGAAVGAAAGRAVGGMVDSGDDKKKLKGKKKGMDEEGKKTLGEAARFLKDLSAAKELTDDHRTKAAGLYKSLGDLAGVAVKDLPGESGELEDTMKSLIATNAEQERCISDLNNKILELQNLRR